MEIKNGKGNRTFTLSELEKGINVKRKMQKVKEEI